MAESLNNNARISQKTKDEKLVLNIETTEQNLTVL